MRPVFSVVMLVAVADAAMTRIQLRASNKNIQRLAHDEPIPEGWRVATIDDVQRNAACFSLVLRCRTSWRKQDKAGLAGDFVVAAFNEGDIFSSVPLHIEKRKPTPEECTCKVVVRFNEGEVLKRERVEHVVNQVQRLCGWCILVFSVVSPWSPFTRVFDDTFLLATIYTYLANVLRSEWIRRRGFI